MSNSYLILHLVDREKYDAVIPAGKPELSVKLQDYSQTRITNTEIDFVDFDYAANVNFNPVGAGGDKNAVVIREKFTDKMTKYVRENEQVLYMEPISKILETARFCGFIVHGKVEYTEANGDAYQYLYFLEKML